MMPAQDDYRDAQYIASTHVCPDCGDRARLVVRWNGKKDEAACGRCHRTEGFVKRKSVTQQWRENPDAIPPQIANRMADKHRDEIESAIEGLPPELANIVRRKYFGLTAEEQAKCQ